MCVCVCVSVCVCVGVGVGSSLMEGETIVFYELIMTKGYAKYFNILNSYLAHLLSDYPSSLVPPFLVSLNFFCHFNLPCILT